MSSGEEREPSLKDWGHLWLCVACGIAFVVLACGAVCRIPVPAAHATTAAEASP